MTVLADPPSLRGRTGGGTGIGAETARIFVRHGIDGVVLAARTEADLERVRAELLELGPRVGNPGVRVLAVPTDVKKEESVVAMVEAAMAGLGRIDVLVDNAGGTRMGSLEDTPTRAWDAVFDLNAKGPFLCTREAGRGT